LTGEDDLLTALVQHVLKTGLEVEDERAPPPYAVEGRGSGNSRNGTSPHAVTTEKARSASTCREIPLDVSPNGAQGSALLDGLTGNVISLYGKRMTTGDIQATSPRSTSVVEMAAWQHRSLDAVYPGRATDTARTVMMKGVLKALLHE
jgi:putative transposase